MLGLYQDGVQIGISQTQAKLNLFGIGQILVGFELGARLFHDELASIGGRHLFRPAQELSIEGERLGSRCRRGHGGADGTGL